MQGKSLKRDRNEETISQENKSFHENKKLRRFERDEELNMFRNQLSKKVKGDNVPHPATDFELMDVSKEVKKILLFNIEQSLWKEPTAIQMQAIPAMLAGRDVLAAAPTGSGKVLKITSVIENVLK